MNDIKRIVRRSGSSFFWCMRFLPKAQRMAMYTIYAFCRHIDDIVDGDDLAMAEKLQLLRAWKDEIDNIYDRKLPSTEIGRKIYKNCMRFKLPKEEFTKLIDALSMDVPNPLQAPSLDVLHKYCRGVAGAPGNLSLRIFGCKDELLIENLSVSMGNALQLTNILRDVKEDAMSNRLYLPKEFLESAGISSTLPEEVLVDKNLAKARGALAELVKKEFVRTDKLLTQLDKSALRPVRAMNAIYRKYFEIMDERGWEVISPKPHLSKLQKLTIAAKAYFEKV